MTMLLTCFLLLVIEGSESGWVFLRAAMATVHFSPELLSEKPATLLMINASGLYVSCLRAPTAFKP